MKVAPDMRRAEVGLLRETVAMSAILAAGAVLAGALTAHLYIGVGLGAGLVIGSVNGHLVAALLDRGAPFVPASIGRLAVVSAIATISRTRTHMSQLTPYETGRPRRRGSQAGPSEAEATGTAA